MCNQEEQRLDTAEITEHYYYLFYLPPNLVPLMGLRRPKSFYGKNSTRKPVHVPHWGGTTPPLSERSSPALCLAVVYLLSHLTACCGQSHFIFSTSSLAAGMGGSRSCPPCLSLLRLGTGWGPRLRLAIVPPLGRSFSSQDLLYPFRPTLRY